jgi:hypothetical protein
MAFGGAPPNTVVAQRLAGYGDQMTVTTRVPSLVVAVCIACVMLQGCDFPSPVAPTYRPPAPTPKTAKMKAVVKGTVQITTIDIDGHGAYRFAVTLTESGGVSATINSGVVEFDNGFGGECLYPASSLTFTRIPANGTLVMAPMTCENYGAFNVDIAFRLTDDLGSTSTVDIFVDLSTGVFHQPQRLRSTIASELRE